MPFIHLPIALRSSHFESDWTKTFVPSAGAFIVATAAAKREAMLGFQDRPLAPGDSV